MGLAPVPGDAAGNALNPDGPANPAVRAGSVNAPNPANRPDRGDFMAKVLAALEGMVTLRVTTVVGPVKLQAVDDFNARTTAIMPADQVVDCATTAINLVQGDITQIRTQKFVDDAAFSKLHDDAMLTARTIIADNIGALKEAILALEKVLWKS
jgi:hypothetical protein